MVSSFTVVWWQWLWRWWTYWEGFQGNRRIWIDNEVLGCNAWQATHHLTFLRSSVGIPRTKSNVLFLCSFWNSFHEVKFFLHNCNFYSPLTPNVFKQSIHGSESNCYSLYSKFVSSVICHFHRRTGRGTGEGWLQPPLPPKFWITRMFLGSKRNLGKISF